MNKFWAFLFVFVAGMVTAINLSMLVETNPDYHAAWWKVFASMAVGLSVATIARIK